MKKVRLAYAAALALSAMAVSGGAHAAWPERAITIIVPFPAGGGTDTFARPLAHQLGEQLGKSVVVDNKGGAGGTLGAGIAARATPDGYTFFMGGAHHVVAPSTYKKLNYDIQKDFVPVALLAQPPQVIVVNPSKLPVNSVKELLEKMKANPGQINFGSAGVGSTHHLAGELFKIKNGVDVTHVPYQGAGPMLTGLITGQVDMAFDGLGSSASHIRAGSIRPLAVASAQRSPTFPDVPTAAEAGVPDYEVSTWYAMWAPAGTPPDVVKKMSEEITKALNTPKIKDLWASNGTAVPNMTGSDFGKFVDSEIKRWAAVVKQAGVEPQ
ncbi:tripartite-type tricarboxylate transporter receptor subunit TctC [Parapusillimonas granuli]|uniref:Tripartite tricarboxylate transporter substrate binding protein n=2 Tax=Parapusillimonas granuli TaxID=380911 RepID=A0A853G189_9BURK|nr:tripartite tricarboxylate transporter substrate binding protein [Parapusillimonas granuli]MBB5213747.1 tripartite-type tricarboxylate transporter receptor subunit TctC [Parapusillimonas granuli]MEB2398823.1 tripartite tricarboxylate transporter substrate binding protein [Alcaligenaceae bacterium]NYT48581.1 tripartite tricarboxylate transporter substrate binding protein [Parapusillimonas granuli]